MLKPFFPSHLENYELDFVLEELKKQLSLAPDMYTETIEHWDNPDSPDDEE